MAWVPVTKVMKEAVLEIATVKQNCGVDGSLMVVKAATGFCRIFLKSKTQETGPYLEDVAE